MRERNPFAELFKDYIRVRAGERMREMGLSEEQQKALYKKYYDRPGKILRELERMKRGHIPLGGIRRGVEK